MTSKRFVFAAAGGTVGVSVCAFAQQSELDPSGPVRAPEVRGSLGAYLMPYTPGGPYTPADDPGDLIPGSLTNVGAQIGENENLGIQYVNGVYWISTRNFAGNHQIHAFDAGGTLTNSIDQVPGAQGSAWGYRDGASDGTFLYFGWDGGVARHNADGTGGTQIISGLAPGIGTYRALAHDPGLDFGNGGFWVQSFASDLIAVTMSGGLLVSFPNNGSSLYGLALADGRLFGFTSLGDIVEIDRNNGNLMGTVFNVASAFTAFGGQIGLSEVPGGGFGSGNAWDLAALAQGTPDEFAVFELVSACPCACDFDTSTGAGVCDLIDFTTFAGQFAQGDPCACDIDTSTGVGVCDLIDFTTFAGQFAGGCP